MNDDEWERYHESIQGSIKLTDEAFKMLEGKTIQSASIEHSVCNHYAEISLLCTDGTQIKITPCQGDTYCFTDMYVRNKVKEE